MSFQARMSACTIDKACLALVTLLSAQAYIFGLGFYSDDWAFLRGFADFPKGSPIGLLKFGLQFPDPARPLQGFYLALMYSVFGPSPLPHHLVNTVVIAACSILVWTLVKDLTGDRRISFAVAVTFALLPQLSTVRVWYAAFQIPMSLLSFLIASIYELRWARDGKLAYKALSLVAAACSLGFYELFGPLLLAGAILSTAIRGWRTGGVGVPAWVWAALPQVANVLLVFVVVMMKGRVSERAPKVSLQLFRSVAKWMIYPEYDWRVHYGVNVKAGIVVNFWDTALLPFRSILRMAQSGTITTALLSAVTIGAIVYWRLARADTLMPRRGWTLRLLVAGLVVFTLGYAVFLLSLEVALSPAGIANRASVAAALGVAAVLVSLALLAVSAAPLQAQAKAFAAGLAVMAALASIRMADIGHHWGAAWVAQRQIVQDARTDLAGLATGATIILDGFCPYIGPGIVLETSWDVAGALTIALGQPVSGDVISPRMSWDHEGLATSIYGMPARYPYSDKLLVYNPTRRWIVPIADLDAATRYFARTDRFATPCNESFVGHGEPI